MIAVRLYVASNLMASLALDAVPREGELLSFSAPPRPDFWAPETEDCHRKLESSLWKVERVVHFIYRKDTHPTQGSTQFVSVYLVSAEEGGV